MHVSVTFQHSRYQPKATFVHLKTLRNWQDLVGCDLHLVKDKDRLLELDIFDIDAVPNLVQHLAEENITQDDSFHMLDRLLFQAHFRNPNGHVEYVLMDLMPDSEPGNGAIYGVPRILEALVMRAISGNTTMAQGALRMIGRLMTFGECIFFIMLL